MQLVTTAWKTPDCGKSGWIITYCTFLQVPVSLYNELSSLYFNEAGFYNPLKVQVCCSSTGFANLVDTLWNVNH